MAALANAKHEAFAQALAKGLSASDAYVAAGYAESRSAASRLSTNVNIQARVGELLSRAAERAEIDVARVLKELVRLGLSDIREAFTPDGHLKNPQAWGDDFAASVASVEVVTRAGSETDDDGNRVVEHVHKIKVWDKNSALEKLAKHLGMFVDRSETKLTHEAGDSVSALMERIANNGKRIHSD